MKSDKEENAIVEAYEKDEMVLSKPSKKEIESNQGGGEKDVAEKPVNHHTAL